MNPSVKNDIEKLQGMSLAAAAEVFISRARANETKRTYNNAVKQYKQFCIERDYDLLPGEPDQVIQYLTYLALSRKLSASTIRTHFSGIRAFYREALGRNNFTFDDVVVGCLNGIQRTIGVRQRSAGALQAEDLQRIVQTLPRKNGELTKTAIRDRALVLVMYAAALRASDVANIRRVDVTFEDRGALLFLRSSKTDQMHKGEYIGIGPGEHPATCPVRALRAWLDLIPDAEFAFCGLTSPRPVSRQHISRTIKKMVHAIGLDPDLYSSHSPRSGITTDLNAAAAPSAVVQERTRHKSAAMVARYHHPKDALVTNFSAKAGL